MLSIYVKPKSVLFIRGWQSRGAVRDYAGKVVCALTVLGPSFRMLAGRIEYEIVPSLVEGAELLSMKFGYAKAA